MKNKGNLFEVLAWGLCVVLAIALFILVFTDRKKYQERIIQMQLETQLQDEDNKNATDTRGSDYSEKASRLYSDLLSGLQLSSFVCWGDNEMAGNSDDSLSIAFGKVANERLLELLSETFADAVDQEKLAVPSMTISNMGVTNEGLDEILVRAGVDDLEIGEWALISEEKKPVNIVLRNGNSGSTLHFAQQREVAFGHVELAGVKGHLTKGDGEYDETHPRIAFVRDRTGDSFQVGQGTPVEIESATKYIGNIPIFFFEDESAYSVDSTDEFIYDLESLVQRYAGIEDENGEASYELPYVVIVTNEEDSELHESLEETFGDHYIRNDTYEYEMTSDGYKELAQKVYSNLDKQGCFDEIKEKIEKAAAELNTEQ